MTLQLNPYETMQQVWAERCLGCTDPCTLQITDLSLLVFLLLSVLGCTLLDINSREIHRFKDPQLTPLSERLGLPACWAQLASPPVVPSTALSPYPSVASCNYVAATSGPSPSLKLPASTARCSRPAQQGLTQHLSTIQNPAAKP